MYYLDSDMEYIKTTLASIAGSGRAIASDHSLSSSFENFNSNFSKLHSIIENGFENIDHNIDSISYQLDVFLDVLKDFKDIQYIQNKERNDLLTSIDASLKAPNKTAASEKYEIALELLKRDKFEHALKFLNEVIELNPLHYRAYVQLTLIHLKLHNHAEALKYAKESLDNTPYNNEIKAYTNYLAARAYERNNDLEKAMHHINLALNGNRQANYIYERARYYAMLNKGEAAINALEESIKMDRRYFAISIVDSAFHPYHKERDQLLTSLKETSEESINKIINKLEAVSLPSYDLSRTHECKLDPKKFTFNSLYAQGDLYSSKDDIRVRAIENNKYIYYSFRNLLEVFYESYNYLEDRLKAAIKMIHIIKQNKKYEDYEQAYEEAKQRYQEMNNIVNEMNDFVIRFREKASDTRTFLENEVKATRLKIEKEKKTLTKLKNTRVFRFLMSDENKIKYEELETKLNREYESLAYAEDSLRNEERETKEIRRFVREVIELKPLPTFDLRR